MSTTSYPLDLTGIASSNFITDEVHSVNEAHLRDYFFIVPNFSPFYTNNFQLSITMGVETLLLVEDIDYSFCMPYITGTRETGKTMYGGITLHNLSLNGVLKLSYRTLGGPQSVDRVHILSVLADKAYNPRTSVWDVITNLPTSFPPVPHFEDYDNLYGQEEVVNKLQDIRDAIATNALEFKAGINELLSERVESVVNLVEDSKTFLKIDGSLPMEGPLTLQSDPVAEMQAVTKKYLDKAVENIPIVDLTGYLKQDGSVEMTGTLKLSGDPTNNLDAASKLYVDTAIGNVPQPDMSEYINKFGSVPMQGPLLLPYTPTNEQDAVNKKYTDDLTSAIALELTETTTTPFIRKDGTVAMVGQLNLSGGPVDNLDATSKSYVDSSIVAGITAIDFTPYVKKDGSVSMTGDLTLVGLPTVDLHATNKKYVDDAIVEVVNAIPAVDFEPYIKHNGTVSMSGALSLFGSPTTDVHATSKLYVDTKASTAESNAKAASTPVGHIGTTGDSHGAASTTVNGFMSSGDKVKLDAISGTHTGVNTGDQTDISGNAGSATVLQTSRNINGIPFNGSSNITINAVDSTARIASSEKGVANGVATLDSNALVPSTQLPSYVDDVLEFSDLATFPTTGETGKIYVALNTNKTYRWSGSVYIYITSGAVDSVAGKTGVVTLVKADIGLGNVDNTSDANKPVSTAQASAIATAEGNSVAKAGSTMTGPLVLSGVPTIDLHATSKKYVDDAIVVVVNAIPAVDFTPYLKKDGSVSMSGALSLFGSPTLGTHATNKDYVDNAVAGIPNVDVSPFVKKDGTVSMTGALTLVSGNPTNNLHAATKLYVDSGLTALGTSLTNNTTPSSHIGTGGTSHANVIASGASGFMTGSDKAKLDAISGTNTGDQTNISGNAGTATKLQTARTIAGVSFDGSANISLVKANIGLGNVDNTSDVNKPISIAQATLNTAILNELQFYNLVLTSL